jgi:serine/threonine protein kinase
MSEGQIRGVIFQTVSGLGHMHKHGFFHRDLKPENLLLLKDVVKICDLGLAREIRSRPPYTDYVATRWYRAPEIILKATNYNSPVDIFAVGCIMAELYLNAPLFCGNSEMDQLIKILSILGTPSQTQWPEGYRLAKQLGISFPSFQSVSLQTIIPNASADAIALLSDMLKFEAEKRPGASQILQHPYFNGYIPPCLTDLQPDPMAIATVQQNVNFASGNEKPQGEGPSADRTDLLRASKRDFHKEIARNLNGLGTTLPVKETSLSKKINLDDSFDIDREINILLKEETKSHAKGTRIQKLKALPDSRSYSQDQRVQTIVKPPPAGYQLSQAKDDDGEFSMNFPDSRMANPLTIPSNYGGGTKNIGYSASKFEENGGMIHAPSQGGLRPPLPEKKGLSGLSNMTNHNAQKLMDKLAREPIGSKASLGLFKPFPNSNAMGGDGGVMGRFKLS